MQGSFWLRLHLLAEIVAATALSGLPIATLLHAFGRRAVELSLRIGSASAQEALKM